MANDKLTRRQKEAVALLSIGTLLEYFDLMLYVHLSVLLNDLFFPKTDPVMAKLLAATAFCMTFILRPVGGYVIGRIGDNIGRKTTILITTSIMASSCLIMTFLPTYENIGIWATIMILLCRMLQGFSSLGEIMGAGIYLLETLKSPYRYIASGIVDIMVILGGLVALGVASLVLNSNFSWRYAFFIGAGIALVGLMARIRLREAADFANYQYRIKLQKQITDINYLMKKKIDKKPFLGLFIYTILLPFGFYIAYIYLGDFMKENLGMTAREVINHNFKFSIISVAILSFFAYLYKFIHPIKIIKASTFILIATLLYIPYCLKEIYILGGENIIFILQVGVSLIAFTNMLLWFKYFPISKRFTRIATIFGIASTLGYSLPSYGLIPLTVWFGYYGIWVLYVPVIIGFIWALSYLTKLEIKRGAYYDYPHEDPPEDDTAINEEDYDYDDLGDEYEPFTHRCEYTTNLLSKLDTYSKEGNVKLNMKLIEKAIVFARKWHDGQMRKIGNIPYYSHPLMVAKMVAMRYLKTDMVVASILHDVVEDSDCTVELVEEKFNHRIAEMVDRLTKKRFENGKHIKLTLEQTLDKLQKLGDNEALFVKQMDRQHNLETIEGLNPEKQRKMAEESRDYFVRLIAITGDKLNIYGKIHLENKMFKSCCDILRKKK